MGGEAVGGEAEVADGFGVAAVGDFDVEIDGEAGDDEVGAERGGFEGEAGARGGGAFGEIDGEEAEGTGAGFFTSVFKALEVGGEVAGEIGEEKNLGGEARGVGERCVRAGEGGGEAQRGFAWGDVVEDGLGGGGGDAAGEGLRRERGLGVEEGEDGGFVAGALRGEEGADGGFEAAEAGVGGVTDGHAEGVVEEEDAVDGFGGRLGDEEGGARVRPEGLRDEQGHQREDKRAGGEDDVLPPDGGFAFAGEGFAEEVARAPRDFLFAAAQQEVDDHRGDGGQQAPEEGGVEEHGGLIGKEF